MATNYLDAILAHHRARAGADVRNLDTLIEQAINTEPTRGFAAALQGSDSLAVIAEVKRRSPSKGDIFTDLSPTDVALAYELGGASCLSVLTDEPHFGGSVADLHEARSAVNLPVIRKDFTVCMADVCDARLMGADAVLLIVAALDDDELRTCHALALSLGLDALVEVHDEVELDRAMAVGATLVGVNQRDLVTFEVDQDRAVRVGALMPNTVVKVAESGVRGPDDAQVLVDAGFDAILVGESLVTAQDIAAAVTAMRSEPTTTLQ